MEHHASAITQSASQAVDYAMSAPGRSARGRAAASSLHAARANDMWCPGGWQRRSCDCAAPTSPSSDRRFRPISSPGSSATTRHVRWPSRAPCRCHWSGHGARSALCGSSACPSSAEGEGSGRTVDGASRWEPTTEHPTSPREPTCCFHWRTSPRRRHASLPRHLSRSPRSGSCRANTRRWRKRRPRALLRVGRRFATATPQCGRLARTWLPRSGSSPRPRWSTTRPSSLMTCSGSRRCSPAMRRPWPSCLVPLIFLPAFCPPNSPTLARRSGPAKMPAPSRDTARNTPRKLHVIYPARA